MTIPLTVFVAQRRVIIAKVVYKIVEQRGELKWTFQALELLFVTH